MEDETKFHWSEGMNYVSEGLKSLFVLNGAATISILTFIGNTKSNSIPLVYAMARFAVGAATGPLAFFLAYLTQLKYGNAIRASGNFNSAWKYHFGTYAAFALGFVLFLLGIMFATGGFLKLNAPNCAIVRVLFSPFF